MTPPSRLDELARLVDLLVDCADDATRERVLLEALAGLDWIEGAALYRRSDAGWHQALVRGPLDALPAAEVVEAVASGTLEATLPHGLRVLTSKESGVAIAIQLHAAQGLGLGREEEGLEEASLDLVEALFAVLLTVQTGADAAPSLLSVVEAPLPATDPEDSCPEAHRMANLLTSINSVQALLSGELGDTPRDDAERYDSIFSEECGRAGALVGEALQGSAETPREPGTSPSAELRAFARRAERELSREGVRLEVLCAPSLDRRRVDLEPLEFRAGLARLVENALGALEGCPPGRRRLQLLWTPLGRDEALLVIEDSAPHARGEDLDGLRATLSGLGLELAPATRREPHGLRLEARLRLLPEPEDEDEPEDGL